MKPTRNPLDFVRTTSCSSRSGDSTDRSNKTILEEHNNRPTPRVELRGGRFVFVVLAGVSVVVGVLTAIRVHGFTIEHGIADPIGSSSHADERVSFYQTVNGFFWVGVGLLLEQYFGVFMATVIIFIRNSKWYPGDRPQDGKLPTLKRLLLFGCTPLATYVVNVGLTSGFIEHRVTDVRHAFIDADLITANALSENPLVPTSERISIRDTILRSSVLGEVVPFAISDHPKCGTTNFTINQAVQPPASFTDGDGGTSEPVSATRQPSIAEIEATSVACPCLDTVGPTTTQEEARFFAFLREANISLDTVHELLVQGITLSDKSFTDSSSWGTYPCTLVDHKEDDAYNALVQNGESEGSDDGSILPNATRSRQLSWKRSPSPRRTAPRRPSGRPSRRSLPHDWHRSLVTEPSNSRDDGDGGGGSGRGKRSSPTFSIYPPESELAGLRMCFGIQSSIRNDVDLSRPAFRNLRTIGELANFTGFADLTGLTITIETFELNPQMRLTSLTIDQPFPDNQGYRFDIDEANCENGIFRSNSTELKKQTKFTPEQWEQYQAEVCDPRYILYLNSSELCGSSGCVFKDESSIATTKKEFTMTPYMKHCDMTKLSYNFDVSSWFPGGCVPQNDSVMLYGMGSYVTGDFYVNRTSMRFPSAPPAPALGHARRHYVYSMAKMEWRFEDVSKRFGARCGVDGGCEGIVHAMQKPTNPTATPNPSANASQTPAKSNNAKVLIVGRAHLKADYKTHSLENPLVLTSLNTPNFYYGENDPRGLTYYIWERLDLAWLNTTYTASQSLRLAKNECSLLVDAFLDQETINHYYIKDPLLPLYASAFFYLFQDATVKDVELPATNRLGVVDLSQPVIGVARMKGDLEVKEIRYSISLVSTVSTVVGVLALLLYLAMMLKWPRDAVMLNDEQQFAAQYAQVLINDRYPRSVHTRRLKLPNDAIVEMDEYVVENIVFHHPLEPAQRVVM